MAFVGAGGNDYGWLRALGHLFRSPDYPYQHLKAWAVLDSAATFLNRMGCGGLVLLLTRLRISTSSTTSATAEELRHPRRMMRHPHILPVAFVTTGCSTKSQGLCLWTT